ncbi:arginine deiminase-related protein, partial [Vibrio mediterranei]|uniref:arginine deiminase-related protein n=1 Tax=Vibrio mediterranei TaxID=689 RepID=UPI0040692A44
MTVSIETTEPTHLGQSIQNANCVVMVPPKEFGFNAQTAADNEFQHQVSLDADSVKQNAMSEFKAMVSGLRAIVKCGVWRSCSSLLMSLHFFHSID